MTKKQRSETRRWLNRYRFLVKEIEARNRDIQSFIEDLYNPLQAVVIDGMPHGTSTSDPTFSAVETAKKMLGRYQVMVKEMREKVQRLESERRQISDAIDSLDAPERCVCFHRFIRGVYWVDLPAYIGYEQRQCQNIEDRALEKIFDKFIKSANDC